MFCRTETLLFPFHGFNLLLIQLLHFLAHIALFIKKANVSYDVCFFSDLSKATTQALNLTVEMMRFLSWLVTHRPTVLESSQWDFLLCSLLAWLEVKCLYTFFLSHSMRFVPDVPIIKFCKDRNFQDNMWVFIFIITSGCKR